MSASYCSKGSISGTSMSPYLVPMGMNQAKSVGPFAVVISNLINTLDQNLKTFLITFNAG